MNKVLADHSDESLVALATGSDPRAESGTEELLVRYRGRIYRWCRRYTQDHEEALDLAQAILLKVHRALPRFSGRSRVSTWIFAITRNECVSAMRRRRITAEVWDEDDGLLDRIADPGLDPERGLIEREAEQRLMDIIGDALDPIEQDALWLRCFDRLSVDEITRSLEIQSASGARGVLQNARRKLRAAIDQRRESEGDS